MRAEPAAETETLGLVEQAQGGDGKAAEVLLLRFRPLIAATVSRCRAHLADGEYSEDDLWQEAYRQFLELLRGYKPRGRDAFGTYLKQMLGWRVANYVRAERRRQRLTTRLERTHLDHLWYEMRPNLGVSLDNPRLRAAVKRLSPKQRSVLFSSYWQDKAAVEIAASEGTTLQAVTALRRRAEDKLRAAMEVSVIPGEKTGAPAEIDSGLP